MEKIDPNKVIIREPKMSDAKSLVSLVNSLVKERAFINLQQPVNLKQEKEYLKFILKKIKNKEAVYFYLDLNGEVVGSSGLTIRYGFQDHIGDIGIIIHPKAQGLGLGEKLLTKVIQEGIKKLKCKIIQLDVFSQNKRAIKLYKKVGFEKIGKVKGGVGYFGKFLDNEIMVKYIK